MCISASATQSGSRLSIHLGTDTARVLLGEQETAELIDYTEDPQPATGREIFVEARGRFPVVLDCQRHSIMAVVVGMTVRRTSKGCALHAHLDDDYYGLTDGKTPVLYTVPAEALAEMLRAASPR
ncbi:hypothetical protein BJ973_004028 [Actinoplanes tereljensis]|uniref:Uncharacterized protein n=1 Tax=Paractinoplanes tereljensis TaxID=571912 RepID=A0A919NXM6_9ACTN|nr:hypothetical protein [Actinoplanes tereljensis]GIF25754.1 hypothetical protein Ate02nite_84840 [Actinoplanes tereljensis]